MSLLHDHIHARNLGAFQRALHASFSAPALARTSSSCLDVTGKSAIRDLTGSQNPQSFNINARDWLGRTALHIACSSLDCIDYVRSLLDYPQIDVNLPDVESIWTPLHRALYSANLPAAVLLLQRLDIDTSLKDLDGYTAFDVYNSTLIGTKPGIGDAELYTWGVNRNATLGVGDGDDRLYPELISIQPKEDPATLVKTSISYRFSSISVRQIKMSRLHTAIVTNEGNGNVRLCGFGSGGRLGTPHTQFSLKPLSFKLPISSVALGQDHTLALTKSGEVYSWGLNRFSQLGYVEVDMPNAASSRLEEPIQYIPKKVVGLLKKEVVLGIAASKNASACWTKDTVFTWGTNVGQLGYDKHVQPVQILPRLVTKFRNPVIELALGNNALAALLITWQVECIWNDRHIRIQFPMHTFPRSIQPYRPPQCIKDAHIVKITCCDDNFAALSSNGDVFTFAPNSSADSGLPLEDRTLAPTFKPQKVWSLRKKFSAVKDVALGCDGAMIVCTESGHVYVRRRNAKTPTNKSFKYDRIPSLQRISQVCANSTGAFAALRIDYRPRSIELTRNNMVQDLKALQPYLSFAKPSQVKIRRSFASDEDELEDSEIENDIESLLELLRVLSGEQVHATKEGGIHFDGIRFPYDADMLVCLQTGQIFPIHRIIFAARSPVMESFLSGSSPLKDTKSKIFFRLLPGKRGPGLGVRNLTCCQIDGCHPLTILILFWYLYSDELLAVWDRRVDNVLQKELGNFGTDCTQVKTELQGLARMFELSALSQALDYAVKYIPPASMVHDMQNLFETMQGPLPANSPLTHDVVIRLADKDVYTHSVFLRSCSPLFANLFDLEDWTVKRWKVDGTIGLELTHLNWDVMRFVFNFICCGSDREMFDTLEFIESAEDFISFMFKVAAAANELLLERLVLICASAILERCRLQNACSILEEATYYHIKPLVERIQDYIAINMEVFLQNHTLHEISTTVIEQLTQFIRARQLEKSPFARSDAFVNRLVVKHADWLAGQDLPEHFVRTINKRPSKGNLRISPAMRAKSTSKPSISPQTLQNSSVALRRPPSGDDIFLMDEPEVSYHPASYKEPANLEGPPIRLSIWKSTSVARVDMKKIMAEAQVESKASLPQVTKPVQSGRTFQSHGESSRAPWSLTFLESSPCKRNTMDERVTRSSISSSITHSTSTPTNPASTSRSDHHTSHGSGLGPVISPKRQSQINSNSRKGGSVKAWSQAPMEPVVKSAPETGMSFVAIQTSQKQAQAAKDIRSFREIQEEELSLRIEADFLKWWTGEEERIKLENSTRAALENDVNETHNTPRKKGKLKRDGTEASGSSKADKSRVKLQRSQEGGSQHTSRITR